ncbi:MAG: AbrB/MazE/SpoVT family DNA-binding domain-containing protein [Methanosarcinales archaeon]
MEPVKVTKKLLESLPTDVIKALNIQEGEEIDIIPSGDEIIIRKVGKRSLVELRGLGKKHWREDDIEEYLGKERDSWEA